MVKQIFPHIRADGRAHFVKNIFLGVLKNTAPHADEQDAAEQIGQDREIAAQDHVVDDVHGEHRRQHIKGNTDEQ